MPPLKTIVISSHHDRADESYIIEKLFESGLECFHIRKPFYIIQKEMRRFIESINPKYHNRLVLHNFYNLCSEYTLKGIHITRKHKRKPMKTLIYTTLLKLRHPGLTISISYNRLKYLRGSFTRYDYAFLTPVFDSISKKGHTAGFREDAIKKFMSKTKKTIYALGGVDEDKIEKARELGFHGVALLGGVWKKPDPLETYRRIKEMCDRE